MINPDKSQAWTLKDKHVDPDHMLTSLIPAG